MALLSRVAEQLYWAARYLERAEDTVRVVRAYTDVLVDLPTSVSSSWEPLLAITGTRSLHASLHDQADEDSIVTFLIADDANSNCVVNCIATARENLRSAREVLPREGWQVVNDLYLYAAAHRSEGVSRRSRSRFAERVIADSQRLDGILSAVMNRDHAYEFLRIGQALERADMTTRVLGVRAAALVDGGADVFAEVQWMGVLRSLSALQMYQRATASPIEGQAVIDFLLHDRAFPRSVMSCLLSVRDSLSRLPRGDQLAPVLANVFETAAQVSGDATNGAELDAETDLLQVALGTLNDAIISTYVGAYE
ncbi:MAG: alpha-E domain-containing protein [Ilumatobacteraceae bacterium]